MSAPLTAVDLAWGKPVPVETYRLLDDVEVLNLPDPEWLIDGVIPRRGLVVVYGPSGTYKTTIVSGLQVAVATLPDWYGHRVIRGGATIYVGAEDVSGYKVRLRAQKRAAQLPLDRSIGAYCLPDAIDLRDATSVARFIRLVTDSSGVFEAVIVDTFAASTPGASENSSEDMTAAMQAAQQIRDALNCTVILVHHTNAGGSRERGHSSMRGASDAMIAITQVDDVVLLECSKQRNGPPFAPLTLKPVTVPEGGCTLKLAADVLAGGPSTTQAKVLTVLRDTFPADGATKSEWQRACQDIPERSFHRAAKLLQERRAVTVVGTHFRATGAK